jgi:hypothetical protein
VVRLRRTKERMERLIVGEWIVFEQNPKNKMCGYGVRRNWNRQSVKYAQAVPTLMHLSRGAVQSLGKGSTCKILQILTIILRQRTRFFRLTAAST